jgi:hypothetical protein
LPTLGERILAGSRSACRMPRGSTPHKSCRPPLGWLDHPSGATVSVMRLSRIVLRSVATMLAGVALGGCAASPERLCGSIVPSSWMYIGPDAALTALHEAALPQAPYRTNEGKPVRRVQRVWYRGGPDDLLACTLARRARDTCSVRTTEFTRAAGIWQTGRENAVLCNVTQ